MFVAATQATILGQPSVGPLDDPADGEFDEAFIILGARDDNDLAARLPFADELREASLGIRGVAKDGIDLGKVCRVQFLQAGDAAGTIGDVAGGDDYSQHQAKASLVPWSSPGRIRVRLN